MHPLLPAAVLLTQPVLIGLAAFTRMWRDARPVKAA